MARPELPGAAVPIQPPVSPFRWAARARFSSLLPKCSFIFRMVVVYWSWNCESCPEIKYFSLFLRTALLFQLIPARGRKPRDICTVHMVIYFNLSPQGDGNQEIYVQFTWSFISTYPRKGTETPDRTYRCTPTWISTYPRKGTETDVRPYEYSSGNDFNLSPQGDGNTSPEVKESLKQ